jgi:AcrR family transcriptional regulator
MHKHRPRLEPRKPPVQKRSQVTVAQLLTAAAQVFEAHGYAAGTTNRIAARAGVSIGTLYQYYPNKEALAVALRERHIVETGQRLHAWVEHMLAERHGLRAALIDYVSGMLEIHAGQPRLQHILLEETTLPERVHRLWIEAEHEAARSMARLLRRYPAVRHARPERAGLLVIQTVESLTHRYAAHPEQQVIDRAGFVHEVASMMEAYLTRCRLA